MKIASETGVPVMRPMFFDCPEDEECHRTGEQYMFGDDIIFAPIVGQGQTEKEVCLPDGKWIFARNGQIFEGGAGYGVKAADTRPSFSDPAGRAGGPDIEIDQIEKRPSGRFLAGGETEADRADAPSAMIGVTMNGIRRRDHEV